MSADEGELIGAVVPLKVQGYVEICGKDPCGGTVVVQSDPEVLTCCKYWITTYCGKEEKRDS